MIYPEHLRPGDTVGLIAPAFPVTEERVKCCISALEGLGLKVKPGKWMMHDSRVFERIQKEGQKEETQREEVRKEDVQKEEVRKEDVQKEAAGKENVQKEEVKREGKRAEIQKETVEDRDGVKGYLETFYLAGRPENRAEDIHVLFADPQVKGIFCVRGGYGSAQIMPYLDASLIAANPKVFVGFSDMTNLLNWFVQKCGFAAYHGPMVSSNMVDGPMDEYTRTALERAVFADWEELTVQNPPGKALECIVPGRAQGQLVGGNVTVFARMTGTFYQPETAGKILFLEDVSEQVASLDMYFTQMENAGVFDRVAGVIFGDFNECENRYGMGYSVEKLLRDRFSARKFPVLAGLCCGHRKTTGTLPMGAWCTMDAGLGEICFSRTQ